MGNVHALAHRATALSMACLSSAALILVSLSGSSCSFMAINAQPDESLITPDGSEYPSNIQVAYIGVKCDSSDFYSPNDQMWALSQLFFYVSLGLGGISVLLAWALSTCLPPTRSNWKMLSVMASATAVLEIPIFLQFEVEPCVTAVDHQVCSLAIGSYFNIGSVILWVAVTIFTVCLEPPKWSQELDAWVTNKVSIKHEMHVYSTDNDTHTDGSMNTAGGMSHDLLQFPSPNFRHHRQSSVPVKNGTVMHASDKGNGKSTSKGPSEVERSYSGKSKFNGEIVHETGHEPEERKYTHEETETQEALADFGVRITTSRSYTSQYQQQVQERQRRGLAPQNEERQRAKNLRFENVDAESPPPPPVNIVGSLGVSRDGRDDPSSLSSSLQFRKKNKMRKQSLADGDISELTPTVADPGVTVTIVCPDGSLKEASLKDPISPCIFGDDDFGEMEELPGDRLIENHVGREAQLQQIQYRQVQRQSHQEEQREFDLELKALDKLAKFHQQDPDVAWAPSDSDSSCGGEIVHSNDKVERANCMYMKGLGSSSVHTNDVGGGWCNPIATPSIKDSNGILHDLNNVTKGTNPSGEAMRSLEHKYSIHFSPSNKSDTSESL